MTETEDRRRWDTDERFIGVADASEFAAAADDLGALARRPGWVAEEPEAHLVPHLLSAEQAGLRVIETSVGNDGVLDIRAEPVGEAGRRGLRQQAWVLIGTVAETLSSVREHRDGDDVIFEVVTGEPDGGRFASHGHALRLTVRLPATA
ncbi:MAG TPA: hypothetical protein VFI65_09245 [Streptosporangiaceae bacterium]|nr:hypothetical protein [Streptosporangiaceae bacterium]